jgi:hypothetical protein
LTGSDNAQLQRLTSDMKIEPATASYMCRIVSVDGIDPEDTNALRNWVEDLDFSDGVAFREAMEASDCGLDTALSVACPRCENEQSIDLPLARGFFQKRKKPNEPAPKTTKAG